MSTFDEEDNDVDHLFDDTDFENEFMAVNELADCYLSEQELAQFLAPSSENGKTFCPMTMRL